MYGRRIPRRLRRPVIAVTGAAALAGAMAYGMTAAASAHALASPAHPGASAQPSRSCGIPKSVRLHGHTYHIMDYGRFGIIPRKGHRMPVNEPAVAHCKAGVRPMADTLNYGGGPLEINPRIYLDFWGSQWDSDGNGVESYMQGLFGGLGTSSDSWSTITSQYTDSSGNHPTFSGTVLQGVWVDDSSASPQASTSSQLAAEAQAAAQHFGVSGTDVDIIVMSPSGTDPDGFTGGGYCAYHTWNGTTAWTNEPYVLDAGSGCGANSVQSQLDGFSITAGHEYAEAITDPQPDSGYVDSSGSEIGDLCAWQNLTALNFGTGTFAMQPLWSNAAGGCVINGGSSGGGGGGGGGGGTTGAIHAGDDSSKCVDDSSDGTSNGNRVQMWDCNGTAAQNWTLASDGTIQVNGKCMDITGANYSNGTPVDLWDCTGGGNQQWQATGGQLVNPTSGMCLDDPGSNTANGTQLIIWQCHGAANQQWQVP